MPGASPAERIVPFGLGGWDCQRGSREPGLALRSRWVQRGNSCRGSASPWPRKFQQEPVCAAGTWHCGRLSGVVAEPLRHQFGCCLGHSAARRTVPLCPQGPAGGSGTWSASPASGSVSPGARPVGWCLGPVAVLAEPLVRGPAVPQLSPEMDVFGGAPRFLAYPRTFTVQSGADAVLKCQIAGDPRPSIIWEKDKSPIALLGRFQVEAEGTVYSLSISQVTPADSGQYVCKAKNAIGETYAAATLKVEAEELQQEGHPEDVPPVFLSKPLSWQVCRGEDVMFTCRVLGQPSPVLQWEKDGRQLSDLFESSHFSVGKEPEDWHFLKIFGARPPDGGVYVCRARNRSGEALAAAVLLVDPMARGLPDGPFLGSPRNCWPLSHFSKQPDQHGDRRHCHGQRSVPWPARPNGEVAPGAPKAKAFAVSEGKHAKFRCYVTGKPKPEIVWKKDGKVVAPDRRHLVYEDREGYFILKVLYCKARDQGLYICTASNTAGQTLSAVQLHVREHRVRFQLQLEDVEVQECEDAVLECKVPLETIPTAWYLEDKQLQPSHKYVIEEQGLVRRLTIRDARADDDGIYLCEMKDKGRSIAEVSVRGAIVKRLPRKLDVMEGENAAFCVETRDAVEGIRWSRNGLELRETPCTVLKSFGKTHLLVLVHVTREDAGVISFSVGESQTSAQLRIKCAKRVPPSAPVAAEMSTDRSNAALLTWCPGPDVHRTPPSSYVLERQEASTAEWVQCLTTDLASMVEVLGDSVPAEADYCFRICAVNKYGRSRPVEFPGSVHLVPVACMRRALKDVQVQAGQDAQFSLELSASVAGSWFLNGAKLEEGEEGQRYCIKRSGTEHSLLLRGVRLAESGAEVKFESSGVRDSATLRVQAPQVRIAPVPEAQRRRELLAGLPLLLECEVCTPDAPVRWLKDGEAVPLDDVVALQAEGCARRLFIRSARPSDSGTYTCDAGEDALSFTVTVTEPPVRIVSSNEDAAHTYLALERVVLACELSRADGPVQWYKDGVEVEEGEHLLLECEGPHRRLVIPSARPQDTGEFVCDAGGDSVFYNISVTEPLVRIVSSNEDAAHTYLASERVVLACELSHANGPVQWYKDGVEVEEGEHLLLECEGPHHRLVIPSARPQDTGEFVCDAGGDSVFYNITVTEPPVRIVSSNEDAAHTYLASERVVLACELSRADGPVQWYKDGVEVEEGEHLLLECEGPHRRLVIPSARPQDTGEFVCDAGGDSVFYNISVTVPAAPVMAQAPLGSVWYKHRSQAVPPKGAHRSSRSQEMDGRTGSTWKHGQHDGQWPLLTRRLAIGMLFAGIPAKESLERVDNEVRIAPVPEAQRRRELLAGLPLLLECEVSTPDAPVRWLKDGEAVPSDDVVALQAEGCARRLFIRSARPSDSGTYTCDTGEDALSFTVTVTEPPVRIVSSNEDAAHTYLASERVVLACELSCADGPVQWYKDGVEVEEGEHLLLECEGPHHRLVIPSARPQDTGEFVCDAGSDSVFYNITVTEPPVRILRPQERSLELQALALQRLELRCELSRADAQVCWFKDGLEVDETENLLVRAEGAQRWLIVPQARAEDAGEYICETRDESVSFDVRVSEPPVKILQPRRAPPTLKAVMGETVTLACELSRGNVPVQWVKDGTRLEAGGSLILEEEGAHRRLVIPAAGVEHSGKYVCDAADDTRMFTVQVCDPPVTILGRGELQTHRHCLAAEDLVLEVTLSHAHGEVKWYKDGEKLQDTGRVRLEEDGARRALVILGMESKDAGEYLCDSHDDSLIFCVAVEVPRVVEIISELHNLTVLEGDDATFKCLVSPDDVALTWQLNGQAVTACERLVVTRNGLCHALTVRQCQLGDAGTVTARAEGLVSTARLSVQEAQVLFVRKLQDVVAEELQDALLEVELSCEAGEVQWLKQGVLVQPGSKYQFQEAGRRRGLTIRSLSPSDRGTYRCESLHDRTQAKLSVAPRKVSVRKPLSDVETFEKETATFQLELSHADVPGVWTRDGIRVKPSRTCRVSATGCVHSLTLLGLTLEDSGTVTFTSDTLRSSARLTVREPPVAMVKAPRDVGVPETGAASFECELSRPIAEVKWYKDGTALQAGTKCRIYSVGRRRLLQLSHCSLDDAGEYTCDAGDCRASATLRVYERQVQIVQELADVRVRENENAVFTCQVSHEDVKGEWFRSGEKIKVTSTVKIRQEGPKHFLLICNVRPEDAGCIRFVAKAAASEASLQVEALPIRIIKPLRDKTALARHKATLECTVSQARGRVRWFRGDTEIFASDKYEICNLDCYRTLIIHGVGPEDEASYTCDAFDDRSTARLLVEGEAQGVLGTGPGGGGVAPFVGLGTTGRCVGQAGRRLQGLRGLQNVAVVAPAEARLECEVSAPLNGEVLGAGTLVGGERGPGARAGAVPDLTQHEWGAAGLRWQCLRQGPAPRARALGAGIGRARTDGSWLATAGTAH
ncbi:obscurin-like protein 1 [Emys orbicularis]|uniref:obscurin-like protein 1 n=1 Tax=Emys orbicularis TaxID=82168 RepID=UPI0031FCE1A1